MRTIFDLAGTLRWLAGFFWIASIITAIVIGFGNSFWSGIVSLLFSWTAVFVGLYQGWAWQEWLSFQFGIAAVALWFAHMIPTAYGIRVLIRPESFNPASTGVGSQWFGFDGRVNRRGFIFRQVLAITVAAVGFWFAYNISGFVGLMFFWPLFIWGFAVYLCAAVRRLHDLGVSGWFALIMWIPGFGQFVLLVLAVLPGLRRVNSYGAIPSDLDVVKVSLGAMMAEETDS